MKKVQVKIPQRKKFDMKKLLLTIVAVATVAGCGSGNVTSPAQAKMTIPNVRAGVMRDLAKTQGGTWRGLCQAYVGPQWGGRKAHKADVSCAAINQGGGMWKQGVMLDVAVARHSGGFDVVAVTWAGAPGTCHGTYRHCRRKAHA